MNDNVNSYLVKILTKNLCHTPTKMENWTDSDLSMIWPIRTRNQTVNRSKLSPSVQSIGALARRGDDGGYEIFSYFFDEEILQFITQEINRYTANFFARIPQDQRPRHSQIRQ